MINKTIIATSILLLSGCATMGDRAMQSVTITTTNNKSPEITICNISNNEGSWQTMGGNATTTIHRDETPMTISCSNPYQFGFSTLKPTLNVEDFGGLAVDVFTTFRVGFVDDKEVFDARYTYPSTVIIKMKDKS